MNNGIRKGNTGWFALLFFAVFFGWFLFSSAWKLSNGHVFAQNPGGYYHHATDALLQGRSYLGIVPRPELAQLSDPYNSALNVPYRELDLSYYQGRYYFYWGMAPVVLLFAPIRFVFGVFPTEALASALFAFGALVAGAALLLRVRRDHFPELGWGFTCLLLLAAGVCSCLPMMPNASVYNIPIACAAFGQICALHFLYQGLRASGRRSLWFVLVGVAASCALASRPNYVLWLWLVGLPILLAAAREPKFALRWPLSALAAPLLTGLAMLGYNYLRFGSLAEFGMHYQLTGPMQPAQLFSPANILPNLSVYGWNRPEVSSLFPYFYTPANGPFGIASFPLVFALLGLAALPKSSSLRVIAWTTSACGIGGLLATCAFFGCGSRYQVDFAPAVLLGASFGAMALMQLWQRAMVLRALIMAAVTSSLLIGMALQVRAWNQGDDIPLSVQRAFNRPFFWLAGHKDHEVGPLKVVFTLPKGKSGQFEPLLSTGNARMGGEIVFLHYVDDAHLRVGFFQTGTTHWLSANLPIDYSAEHELLVVLGSLFPDGSHPFFDGWPDKERTDALADVVLVLNGTRVFKTSLAFSEDARRQLTLGENSTASGICGPTFTGSLRSSREPQATLTPAKYVELASIGTEAKAFGSYRLSVRFPKEAPIGSYEPLLVSGVTGKADFFYVFYPEPGKIAFGHDCWSVGGSSSKSMSIDPDAEYLIEIDHAGLHDRPDFAAGQIRASGSFARIRVNGAVVLEVADRVYDSLPDSVVLGENRLGGSTTSKRFTGEIFSSELVKSQ